MKNLLMAMAAMMLVMAWAAPSENTFHAVTNDWYHANFSNVYELAQVRLASNEYDVVGAHLMMDWDLCFSDFAAMSNSVTRLIAACDLIAEPAFTNIYSILRGEYMAYRDEYLPKQQEDERAVEQQKGWHPGGFLSSEYMLELLWKCGLW